VTNVTFALETSLNTKLKESNMGGRGILHPRPLKTWGDTSPCTRLPTYKLLPWR